jgi:type II secretory pathway pseudopilin PulG
MKRCPTCQRTFTDPNLSFCVEDGSPLITVDSGDEPTVVTPRGANTEDEWGAVAYRPPSSYLPSDQPKKKVWPWLLGIGLVVLLVVAGLGIAAAVYIPRMMKEQQARREVENRQQPANTNENTNSSNTNASGETDHTPPPTDEELVLAQLTQLENEWTVANINADKKKLEVIIADDYVGPATTDPNGPTQGKDEYIKTIQRDSSTEKWEFKDLHLTLRGERATLTGKVNFTVRGQVLAFTFTDKFVWRNGRWQATGSEVTRATEV